jgi:hypothetical protein
LTSTWGYYVTPNTVGIVGAAVRVCNAKNSEGWDIAKQGIGPRGRQLLMVATFTLSFFSGLHKLWYKQLDGENVKSSGEYL